MGIELAGGAVRVRSTLARWMRAVGIALALVVLVGGCKSFYPVDVRTAEGLAVLAPGERVRVTTRGGEEREFEVTESDRDHVAGARARYTASEIAKVERHEYDAGRSLALGTGVYVLVAVVATAVIVAELGGSIF